MPELNNDGEGRSDLAVQAELPGWGAGGNAAAAALLRPPALEPEEQWQA